MPNEFADGDLKLIDGIGPAMEVKLHELGVADIKALAEQDDAETLAELIASRGVDADRVRDWIAQAQGGGSGAPEPEVAPEPEAAPEAVSAPVARSLSLHELNMQARKIDREHAAQREAAKIAMEKAAKEVMPTAAFHRPRRFQKNLRPLVKK